jgi:hypothetical protein
MFKFLLLLASIGHIICGITDCLFAYGPNGKVELGKLDDYDKISNDLEGMSLKQLVAGMLIGVISLTAAFFGYMALCDWMYQFSHVGSIIMYISSAIYLLMIVCHHIQCGTVEWFFVKQGRTRDALDNVTDYFKTTSLTMVFGYLGLLVFAITFFVIVVMDATDLPRWACIANTLPLYIIIAPTKLPAKGNIAGAAMWLALFLII